MFDSMELAAPEAVQGFWLFGKYVVPGNVAPPIEPPVNQEEEQEKPAPVKRIFFMFDGHRFPCPLFSPALRNLLSSMNISKKRRPKRVITRTLTPSDVKKGLARLLIPSKKIHKRFLKDWEEKLLEERDDEGKLRRLEVAVVDPMLAVRTLNFKRWNYMKSADPNAPPRKNWSYILNCGWTDVVDGNRLVAGNTVQIWSFRKSGGSLGFIIFKVQLDIYDQ